MDLGFLFSVITKLFLRWEILATAGFTVLAFIVLRTIAIPDTRPKEPPGKKRGKAPKAAETEKAEDETGSDEIDGEKTEEE